MAEAKATRGLRAPGQLRWPPLEERLWSRIAKVGECWEYQGSRTKRGYGRLGSGGQMKQAHRVAYELAIGPVPSGLVVMHMCDNPPCINPDHLRAGTVQENNADIDLRGRRVYRGGSATHCPKGHLYEGGNIRMVGKRRHCRTCGVLWQREYAERKKLSGR